MTKKKSIDSIFNRANYFLEGSAFGMDDDEDTVEGKEEGFWDDEDKEEERKEAETKLGAHDEPESLEGEAVEECDVPSEEKAKSLKKIAAYAESVILAAKDNKVLRESLLKNFGEKSLDKVAARFSSGMDGAEMQRSIRSIHESMKKYGSVPEIVEECEDKVEECHGKEIDEASNTDTFAYVYDSFLNGDSEPMGDEISDAPTFGKFIGWVVNVAKASDETLSELTRYLANKIR